MAEKAKQEKTENQEKWNYQRVSRKAEKKSIGYYNGHVFTY